MSHMSTCFSCPKNSGIELVEIPPVKFMIYFYMYIWVIDEVWGQDGWILAKFLFFYVFMARVEIQVHKLAKKKNDANIQPSWPNQ